MDRWITDWPIDPDYPLLTRANAGEVLRYPASPLGFTFVFEQALLPGWVDSARVDLRAVGDDEITDEHPAVVGSLGGYLYINATSTRIFGLRAPGLSPEMVDYTYFGEHPDVPPYEQLDWHDRPELTAQIGEWMGSVVAAEDLPELRSDRELADAVRAGRPDLSTLTDAALVERAQGLLPLARRLFQRHLTVTAGASIGPGIVAGVAAALGDETLPMRLVAGVGDVDSAAPSHALWAISRLAQGSAELRAAWSDFMVRFGSRGPNEWDLRSETWETDPTLAEVLADRMRAVPDGESPLRRVESLVEEREVLCQQVAEALAGDPETQAQFLAGVRSAHLHLAGRERTKTNVVKVIHEMRMAFRELALRHDYTMSQLCMLLADELDAFVSDPDELRPRLVGREQDYLTLFDLEPPFIVNGIVEPLSAWPRRSDRRVEPAVAGDVLHGVPGCPGEATGIARVVLDPGDPLALGPGEVLIAPITDPAWTPLFVPAAAVVVDVGAQVSHAIIVSRELGIPCVVSVTDATRRIPDGALVRVNGTTGEVTILSM